MTYLAETYYHRINPPGFRLPASSPRTASWTRTWRSDVGYVLVPRGHIRRLRRTEHMYYLNVMAGPKPKRFRNHSDHD